MTLNLSVLIQLTALISAAISLVGAQTVYHPPKCSNICNVSQVQDVSLAAQDFYGIDDSAAGYRNQSWFQPTRASQWGVAMLKAVSTLQGLIEARAAAKVHALI